MGGKVNAAMTGAATGASVGGPWGAAIGGVGGYLLGSDDESGKQYEQLMQQAQSIPLPMLQKYYPELYKQVVQLNPEMETAQTLGPSAMEGISTDPRLKEAQMNALLSLQGIGANKGMDAQAQANMARLQSDVNQNLQGQTGAIQQNLATRGMSGGMSELVARNLAAQGGANRQAQMGMDEKAQAEQRALSAIAQSGQLGGQMQSNQFNQAAQQAQARDLINKFNLTNTQGINSQNVQARNQAQAANAQGAQNIANLNVGGSNEAQKYNINLPQQQYANQLSKYGLQAQAGQGLAQSQSAAAQQQNQFLGNAMQSGAYAYGNQTKKKLDANGNPVG